MTIHDLSAVNATLNGTCAILLLAGRNRIKQGRVQQHRALMISAFIVSMIFLVSYLVYHYNVGSVHFNGTGWSRPVYFTILITHTVLAATIPVLATMTLIRGLKARFLKHVRIAKWTYPLWLYVSVTGVVIYFMLYQIFPAKV